MRTVNFKGTKTLTRYQCQLYKLMEKDDRSTIRETEVVCGVGQYQKVDHFIGFESKDFRNPVSIKTNLTHVKR